MPHLIFLQTTIKDDNFMTTTQLFGLICTNEFFYQIDKHAECDISKTESKCDTSKYFAILGSNLKLLTYTQSGMLSTTLSLTGKK